MPLYLYNCKSCGEFQDWQAMTACDQPAACPRCGRRSRRVVSAPKILAMDANLRKAHARNERSAHEPRLVRRDKQKPHDHVLVPGAAHGHGPHFHRSSRPWMIGH